MGQVRINGVVKKHDKDQDMPLLWYLRDVLKLRGTKFGCGMGLCGACTVHLNGNPVRSCQLPLSGVEGQDITTIEGLCSDPQLHPVQQAWVDFNVPQCGYCQPGQIMSAAALLKDAKGPMKDEVIDQAMRGNICRCGTYPRIKKAIHAVVAGHPKTPQKDQKDGQP